MVQPLDTYIWVMTDHLTSRHDVVDADLVDYFLENLYALDLFSLEEESST